MIPLAIFPTIFTSFASGLYFLLQAGSATGKSVGFQIIGGIGSGAGHFRSEPGNTAGIQAPTVNARDITNIGATAFRAFVQPSDLPIVLVAYANSIYRAFSLVAAMADSYSLFVWRMDWNDTRKKASPKNMETGTEAAEVTKEEVV
ncbi:hypothetical protein ACMFMF_009321 [Clarireedia jacksonii]